MRLILKRLVPFNDSSSTVEFSSRNSISGRQLSLAILCLGGLAGIVGCSQQSTSQNRKAAAVSSPVANRSVKAENRTNIDAFPDTGSLFDKHQAFLFELSGAPVTFQLEVLWSPLSPLKGKTGSEVIYNVDAEVIATKLGKDLRGEADSSGYIALLVPQSPESTVEVDFKRGNSGFRIGETLQDILPAEAAEMTPHSVWVTAGGNPHELVASLAADETETLVEFAQLFESEKQKRYLIYKLTVTGVGHQQQ